MGKGQIISGGTAGLYSVQLLYERSRVITSLANLASSIAELEEKIPALEGRDLILAELQLAAFNRRKDYLSRNLPSNPVVSAWCADLTENLAGEVGTIEVSGERTAGVNIQPGYNANAAYNGERDGQLQPSIASTPAGSFYNLAMLPGWQKWKPTYRYGTITSINHDNDTCNVTLENIKSSQQNLSINKVSTLTGVPIVYMTCNSQAFAVGDSVIVKLEGQDWNDPVVIGFKDNPKGCAFYIRATFNGYSPSKGLEIIKLSNGVEEVTRIVDSGGIKGIAGPYPGNLMSGDIYLAPYPYNQPGRLLFAHYQETPAASAQYHFGYKFSDTPVMFGVTRKELFVGLMPEEISGDPILHVNRVWWHRHPVPLAACSKTTEEINGVSYPVYLVDFSGLYCLRRKTIIHAKNGFGYCGAMPVAPEITEDFLCVRVSGVTAREFGGADVQGYEYIYSDGIERHVTPFALLKNQICILMDENGEVSFNGGDIFQIWSNIYFNYSQAARLNDDGGFEEIYCTLEHVDFYDCTAHEHQMVLTPAEQF